jgi:hypothetical protein
MGCASYLQMRINAIERNWKLLWKGPAGKRFENYYRRNHKNGVQEGFWVQMFRLAVALVFLCVGVLLLFLPLVYIPFLLVGTALLASESRSIARFLDHSEMWVRRTWARFKTRFGISQTGSKIIFATLGVGCIALAGLSFYKAFVR